MKHIGLMALLALMCSALCIDASAEEKKENLLDISVMHTTFGNLESVAVILRGIQTHTMSGDETGDRIVLIKKDSLTIACHQVKDYHVRVIADKNVKTDTSIDVTRKDDIVSITIRVRPGRRWVILFHKHNPIW